MDNLGQFFKLIKKFPDGIQKSIWIIWLNSQYMAKNGG